MNTVFYASAGSTRLPDESIDVLIASDVIEHVEDDRAALEEWFRILKPTGRLILFAPAYPWLWSVHDEKNHHFRRYRKKELYDKLRQAGFVVEKYSFWNLTLALPLYLFRLASRLVPAFDRITPLQLPGPFVNRSLLALLIFENKLLAHVSFSVGISLMAVARRN
jgi:SAM-dependent methyltransferase